MTGLAIFGWSSLCMSEAGTSTYFWDFVGWIALGRVGLGLIMPSLNSGALRLPDAKHMAQGAGAINFSRQLGGALGVSMLSVYLERQTEIYAQAFSALQNGTHAASDALNLISSLFLRGWATGQRGASLATAAGVQFSGGYAGRAGKGHGLQGEFFAGGSGLFCGSDSGLVHALCQTWLKRGGQTVAAGRRRVCCGGGQTAAGLPRRRPDGIGFTVATVSRAPFLVRRSKSRKGRKSEKERKSGKWRKSGKAGTVEGLERSEGRKELVLPSGLFALAGFAFTGHLLRRTLRSLDSVGRRAGFSVGVFIRLPEPESVPLHQRSGRSCK